MTNAKNRKIVPGSQKKLPKGARVIGEVDPEKRIEIMIMVRRRTNDGLQTNANKPSKRSSQLPVTPQERIRETLAEQGSADPNDMVKVEAFAREYNLAVVKKSILERSLRLAGTIGDLTEAFQVNLKQCKIGSRLFRGRTGGISIPRELSKIIVGVYGFDDRTVRRLRRARPAYTNSPENQMPGAPPDIARQYHFPTELDGSGQCIGIIGFYDYDDKGKIIGYGFSSKDRQDLEKYFTSLGGKMPTITAVDANTNAEARDLKSAADPEVMLDVKVAGAVAPGSNIVVYLALNHDLGMIDAVNAAVHDKIRKPSVISISWALDDDGDEALTEQSRSQFSQILRDAANRGVTVCCASGDDGSSMCVPEERDGRPHSLYFPAADPLVLACGGTQLVNSGRSTGEVVWKADTQATGGGVSDFYPRPDYQSAAGVPMSPNGKIGRGGPDVAAYAGGYKKLKVRFPDGKLYSAGGTSSASPLWAGLIALINQKQASIGKLTLGFINPLLYMMSSSPGVFRDIVQGDNDLEGVKKYPARKGWDACTGLGAPDGTKLMAALCQEDQDESSAK